LDAQAGGSRGIVQQNEELHAGEVASQALRVKYTRRAPANRHHQIVAIQGLRRTDTVVGKYGYNDLSACGLRYGS